MPECDGITATRAIRTWSALNANTPIVALTANAGEGDRASVAKCGMNGLLTKPCSLQKLREVVEKWVPSAIDPSAALRAEESASSSI